MLLIIKQALIFIKVISKKYKLRKHARYVSNHTTPSDDLKLATIQSQVN